MLKKIPANLSPDLVKTLMEMGHGDTIVIADGNYPSKSNNDNVIRYDGNGVNELLDSILELFPLDTYVEQPVLLMNTVDKTLPKPEIWNDYEKTLKKHGFTSECGMLERHTFYEESKKAYAIVATGETAIYANIILVKGVV